MSLINADMRDFLDCLEELELLDSLFCQILLLNLQALGYQIIALLYFGLRLILVLHPNLLEHLTFG